MNQINTKIKVMGLVVQIIDINPNQWLTMKIVQITFDCDKIDQEKARFFK